MVAHVPSKDMVPVQIWYIAFNGGVCIVNETYRWVYNKDHARANNDGYVYEHIIIAEQKLGRLLTSEEVVHHIDHNRKNNKPENLMVFRTNSDHIKYHHGAEAHLDGDVFVCESSNKICPVCNQEFYGRDSRRKFCSPKCSQIAQRRVPRPSYQELVDCLNEGMSFVELGTKYGVSDRAVRKWMRKQCPLE